MTAKPKSRTPLFQAILKKNLEEVMRLLAAGADPNELSAGYTPLQAAIHMDHVDMVSELLKSGARPNDKGEKGHAPLAIAASKGSLSCATVLLDKGASIYEVDRAGGTPLMDAARSGSVEVVSLLLSRGADPDRPSADGDNALSLAAWAGKAIVVERLLAQGAMVNNPNHPQRSPLLRAAARGRTEVIRRLLDSRADLQATDSKGRTALHCVAMQGYATATFLLLGAGADPNARDDGGRTPLLYSTNAGHRNASRVLISHGADPSLEATDGKEPKRVAEFSPPHREVHDATAPARPVNVPPLGWRILLGLSRHRAIRGLDVAVIGLSRKEREIAFKRIGRALELIALYAPAASRRLHRSLRGVWGAPVLLGARGSFRAEFSFCVLDENLLHSKEGSAAEVATVIIHEATHARLDRLGFAYSEQDRLRVERACVRAQIAFVRGLPGEDRLAAKEESALCGLSHAYLTNSAKLDRQIAALKAQFGQGWFTRFAEWRLRRMAANK